MTTGKSILLGLSTMILGIVVGAWATSRKLEAEHQREFIVSESVEMDGFVRGLHLLRSQEYEKAVNKLESLLDVKILVLGNSQTDPKNRNENALSALSLAAKHREKYPFATKSPGSDQMVQAALKIAK